MEKFLVSLYQEEQEKKAAANFEEFLMEQPVEDLAAMLGISKRAVAETGGDVEGPYPDSLPGKKLDEKMKLIDSYVARSRGPNPPTREEAGATGRVNYAGPSVLGKKITPPGPTDLTEGRDPSEKKASMIWADRMGKRLADHMSKTARIFGQQTPDEVLLSPQVPYEHRRGAYETYLKDKSQEAPTSLGKALLGGGLVGAVGGGLMGSAGGLGSAGLGAGLGGLTGLATGALMRHTDKQEIARARQALGGNIDADLASHVGLIGGRRAQSELAGKERRHAELMDALQAMHKQSEGVGDGAGQGLAGQGAGQGITSLGSWEGPPTHRDTLDDAHETAGFPARAAKELKKLYNANHEPGSLGRRMIESTPLQMGAHGLLGAAIGTKVGLGSSRPGLYGPLGGVGGAAAGAGLGALVSHANRKMNEKWDREAAEKEGGLGDAGVGTDKTTIASVRAKIASRAIAATRGAPPHIRKTAAVLVGQEIARAARKQYSE